jgi:hypothetical protein
VIQTLTQPDFIPLIELELALLGLAYDRAELLTWTSCVSP